MLTAMSLRPRAGDGLRSHAERAEGPGGQPLSFCGVQAGECTRLRLPGQYVINSALAKCSQTWTRGEGPSWSSSPSPRAVHFPRRLRGKPRSPRARHRLRGRRVRGHAPLGPEWHPPLPWPIPLGVLLCPGLLSHHGCKGCSRVPATPGVFFFITTFWFPKCH